MEEPVFGNSVPINRTMISSASTLQYKARVDYVCDSGVFAYFTAFAVYQNQ